MLASLSRKLSEIIYKALVEGIDTLFLLLTEKRGCFSLVLECIPDQIAQMITDNIDIPTIGIGAGVHCDGQVLVTHDLLGLFDRYRPKFAKQYTDLGPLIHQAIEQYKNEVLSGQFPSPKYSFTIPSKEIKRIIK